MCYNPPMIGLQNTRKMRMLNLLKRTKSKRGLLSVRPRLYFENEYYDVESLGHAESLPMSRKEVREAKKHEQNKRPFGFH